MNDKERIEEARKKAKEVVFDSLGIACPQENEKTKACTKGIPCPSCKSAVESITKALINFNSERIAELERENESLRNGCRDDETRCPYYDLKPKVEQLQKENSELHENLRCQIVENSELKGKVERAIDTLERIIVLCDEKDGYKEHEAKQTLSELKGEKALSNSKEQEEIEQLKKVARINSDESKHLLEVARGQVEQLQKDKEELVKALGECVGALRLNSMPIDDDGSVIIPNHINPIVVNKLIQAITTAEEILGRIK